MIVLETSALLEWILRGPNAESIDQRLEGKGPICVPHLLDFEVVQLLSYYCDAGQLQPERALEALQDLRDLDLRRFSFDRCLERIWQLRENATPSDATFIALAEQLGAPLVTCDRHFLELKGHSAKVEVICA